MISHAFVKLGILVVFFVGVAAPAATAETITIHKGTLVIERGRSGLLDVSGNRGFKFQATAFTARFDAMEMCTVPECTPGTVVELGAVWSGLDLPGTAMLRGKTYLDVGGFDSPSSAEIRLSGEITMPPMSDGPVSITVPFRLTGQFAYGDETHESQVALLTGGGFVTLVLEPYPSGQESWIINSAVFEFRPGQR